MDTRHPQEHELEVEAGALVLPGHLTVPPDPVGIVVFAHGTGSSRHSPRNQALAAVLHRAHLATLLFDLLTPAEAAGEGGAAFGVDVLASRLAGATAWARARPDVGALPVGYLGASTGAAVALWAAAEPASDVVAIVSRGGRPDLAAERLAAVTAPTLLIVGSFDEVVLGLNRQAAAHLTCEHRLTLVEGASHLFEEPGTLHEASVLARAWFAEHLGHCPPS